MPLATRSGPILSNQTDDPAPISEPDINPANQYNTRKKRYVYSHSKAPYIPPPPRPSKRPPPPISVAFKRQRLDVGLLDENVNTNTGANSNINSEAFIDRCTIEYDGERVTANSEVPGSSDQQTNENNTNYPSTLPRISDHSLNPGIGVPEPEFGELGERPTITEMQPSVTHLSQSWPNNPTGAWTSVRPDNMDSTHNSGTSVSTSDFATPRRPARSAGFTTPTVLIIATPPSWARFGTQQDSHLPPFPSTMIQSFNQHSARIEDIDPNNPTLQNSFRSGDALSLAGSQVPSINIASTTEHAPCAFSETATGESDSASHLNPPNRYTPTPRTNMARAPSASLTTRSSTSTLSRMCNVVRQTLPPTVRPAPQSSNYHNSSTAMVRISNPPASQIGLVMAPGTTARSSDASIISGPHSLAGSLTRTSSLVLDDRSTHAGSTTRDSPASVTASQTSASHTHTQPQRALRQRDFNYDQVKFMDLMRRRWHWYLIADDLFPVNTKIALELCTQYAENHLEVSRMDCDITRTAVDFVRKKESAIRNLFQTGLLSIVEEGYGVNTGTITKLSELISQSNYVYAEYDIATKKVSGRYRHPCLIRVLNAVLFTKRKRGRPIGLCFMQEVIGEDSSEDFTEPPTGTGISVTMIALACTLVLYALQSIKAGDTSQRLGTRKGKPLHLTEKKYTSPYRNFVTKLQQYNRLDELRKTYLEEVMKEYLQVHTDNNEDSDADIEANDEMHSDGD